MIRFNYDPSHAVYESLLAASTANQQSLRSLYLDTATHHIECFERLFPTRLVEAARLRLQIKNVAMKSEGHHLRQ